MDQQDAPHIPAHFGRKGIPLACSTIDNIMRRQIQEGRIKLKPHHSRTPRYSDTLLKEMADIQKGQQPDIR